MSAEPDCRKLEDYAPAIIYLRRDIFSNNCLLDALEHNVPPIPREVFIACDRDGAACGVMSVEQFPGWVATDLRAYPMTPEAITALVRALDPAQEYSFSIRSEYWDHVRPELDGTPVPSAVIAMTVEQENLRALEGPAVVRKLTRADMSMAERFPPFDRPHQPTLAQFIEYAEDEAKREVVYGSIFDAEIVSYVEISEVVENIWEVGFIVTREEHKGRGLAKQLLSHATRELVCQGIQPLYQVAEHNIASLRTAEAVGYRKAFRVLSVVGRRKA